MVKRSLWLDYIQRAWNRRSIIWLSSVRRLGKTTLTRMLPDAVYMNCDLPSTLRVLEEPELFLDSQVPGGELIFDEIHQQWHICTLFDVEAYCRNPRILTPNEGGWR